MKSLLKEFKEAQSLPSNLSDLHYKIAHHFGETSADYEEMIPRISTAKRTLIDEHKTITKAKQEYDISEVGQIERKIKIRLKSLAVLLGAIRRRIETLDLEAKSVI